MTRTSSTDSVSRRRFLIGASAAGVVGVAGCTSESDTGNSGGSGGSNGSGSGNQLSGPVELSGSSTVYPLANAVAGQFQQEHPEVSVNVRKTGTGGGFQQFFCQGRSDLNNASRPITDQEQQLCSDNGIDPVELKVATDAVTVAVNNEADFVDCVTVEELAQIWSADGATTWSDVRPEWPDKEIQRYGAAETSGTYDYFNETILGEDAEHTQDYQATERDNSIVQGVTDSQYAIGYFGFAYYSENTDRVKALAIDDGDGQCVKPSLETAKSGAYQPLSRPLFTYASTESLRNKQQVAEFTRYFIQQSTSRSLVADQIGYVPNTEGTKQEQLQKIEQAISGGSGGGNASGNATGSGSGSAMNNSSGSN